MNSTTKVTFRGTPDELRRVLAAVPGVLAGSISVPERVTRALNDRIGSALLKVIREDFIAKASGRRGKDGRTWDLEGPQDGDGAVDDADLDRMYASLSEDRPTGDTVKQSRHGGTVAVGSSAVGFDRFNRSYPVLPVDGQIPDAWMPDVMAGIEDGIAQAIAVLLESGWRP